MTTQNKIRAERKHKAKLAARQLIRARRQRKMVKDLSTTPMGTALLEDMGIAEKPGG